MGEKPGHYDVTIMFRVPRSVVESKTPQEWMQQFLDNNVLDLEWFREAYDDLSEFDHDEVAKVLAYNYMGAGDYVSGYETMETDVERTWEE